ncbi:hypothetical protein AS156_00875 [Bradyrhizobium macuxiense]|uniref:Uncharacterized protein n=1 Tax=Bradyrhizobium macuxiense TaxID=1755647 RepID=A0A109JSS6_9BRAD|nr:hypothetical protein AS156_00875 [Bradyrhizobium macuxiense]
MSGGQSSLARTRIVRFPAWAVRAQEVNTKATRVHSQSGPSAALETGSEAGRLNDTSAAKQAHVTTAAASAAPFRDHSLEIIALVPVDPMHLGSAHPAPL